MYIQNNRMVSIELSNELIPGLPEELGLECLTRFHYSTQRIAALVCRRWQQIIQSRHFYYLRKRTGHTQKAVCLIQLRTGGFDSDGSKPVGQPRYGITVFDPVGGIWGRVDPVPKYPYGLPLFCQMTSTEGKLVVMGGWDPSSYDPVRDVFIYDFTTQRWRQGKQMPGTRSFFAAGGFEGRVVVAGGHDENKNALNTTWEYDTKRDEWTELTMMSQERDECHGMVIGSEFWVVSGYRTDNQGGFEESAELMDLRTGQWSRVEEVWKASQSPRSCVGVGKDNTLFFWGYRGSRIRVGACAVPLGECTFVSGSAYQGGQQEFFLVDRHEEKFKSIHVPVQFSGFVQSGCSVDI
ncbi:RNA binding,RNA binding isoform 1 [Hibiscus syriacus]|uniref:RNA binding,RNA binding isoform 1 n=1 Tax=Hibiscus syriacus TaxID=106335 RepID=A0A6A3A9W7_HIBSY|nr:F-box/kelch-repeat protein At2g44130-like [Hibiscus syriacus]KAE8700918.1 RNA binding,RNA binding isoform 1 [Hibiscus syriacus]